MNKDFERISKQSANILGDYPEKHEELIIRVKEAEEAVQRAEKAVDRTEDIEEYDNAVTVLERAKLEYKFAKTALKKLESAPRMDEDEYQSMVDTIQNEVMKAAEAYRKVAAAAFERILAAHDEYKQLLYDADMVLGKLDAAANVLQVKYRYREIERQNMEPIRIEDPNEWSRHSVRYVVTGKGYEMVTREGNEQNEIQLAAWNAAEKVKGENNKYYGH